MRRIAAALLSISLAASVTQAQTKLSPAVRDFVKFDAPIVVFIHARVIDGTGAAPLEDQTLIIEGGKVKAMGKTGSVEVPHDAKVLDLAGNSVIPGLVGMHDHMFYPAG